MYRISADPRAVASAKKVIDGLENCLERKKLSDISVSEVCRLSGVGRATFYRLFDTPIDVLQYHSDLLRRQRRS